MGARRRPTRAPAMPEGPISREEWAALRRETRQAFPTRLGALPDVLLLYQQQLLATTATNEVTVVQKSRRTGYTWGVGSDAVLTSAAARSAGGMDTLYIGYNLDMAREFIDVCAMWGKAFSHVASEVEEFVFTDRDEHQNKHIQAFRITLASGFEIMALSSRPRSLRGHQGYVIVDEAAFHDDFPGLLKAALALLIWGGKILVISTHDGVDNPFNQLVEDVKSGRAAYALITLDFDDAIRQGLYQRICLVTGREWTPEGEAEWRQKIIGFYGDGADEELFVIPANGSGTYLPAMLIERQQKAGIPVLRWARGPDFLALSDAVREAEARAFCEDQIGPALARLDPDLPSYLGEDFAMTGDLTVLWPLQIGSDMVRRPPFTIELRRVPYSQQKQILWWVIRRLPRLSGVAMDATGNGAPLAQETAVEFGLSLVQQVMINLAWYAAITPKFKAAFEDGLTELPKDLDVYQDHRALKLVRGVAQVVRQDEKAAKGEEAAASKKGARRHGDSAIAHMMAIYAASLETTDGLLRWYREQVEKQLRGALK
jgi:phage FluMu gp28-like protein